MNNKINYKYLKELNPIERLEQYMIRRGTMCYVEPIEDVLMKDLDFINTQYYTIATEVSKKSEELLAELGSEYRLTKRDVVKQVKESNPFTISEITSIETTRVENLMKNSFTYKTTFVVNFYRSDFLDMEAIKQIYELKEKLEDGEIEWRFLSSSIEAAIDLYYEWKDETLHIPINLWLNLNSDLIEKYR